MKHFHDDFLCTSRLTKALMLSFFLLLSGLVYAQPGTPSFYDGVPTTSGNSFPYAGTTNKVVWVHPPGSFTTNGTIAGTPVGGGNNITKIYIRMVGANAAQVYAGFEISMKQTGATTNTFAAGAGQAFLTGMTTVYYNNAFQFTGITANSWYGITLQTPFTYDPSQSLYIECKTSTAGTTNTVNSLTVAGANSRIYAAYAATTGTGGSGLTPLGIDVIPNSPCIDPPTPGTATASVASVCTGGSALLSLTGQSNGFGQSYQWESSTTSGGTFTPVGASSSSSGLSINPTAPLYYRCQVTCGVSTLPSTEVFINVPTPFPAGYYTIDNTLPTGSGNFASFGDAVSAIACGIAGPVTFEVSPGTGPYTEQVTLPQIGGASATNTITFLGNNETLTYNATNASLPHTFSLNGTDWVRVNDLNIVGTNATYALVGHLWNNANDNIFTNCTFTAPANGTSTLQVPFSCSGSETSATTTGLSGSNNELISCTMNSGYYNTCFVGNSGVGLANTGNKVINCNIRDQYFYGSYNLYQNGMIIRGNTLDRLTRTTLSTYYGIYVVTGCTNMLVENNKIRKTWEAVPTSTGTQYSIYCSIDATLGNENKFYNNLISDINFNGTIYGMYMLGADYWKGYHNTVSLDQTTATGTTTTYGIYCSGTVAYDVQNNNVSITRGGTGTKYAMTCTAPAVATSNYNNLYVNAAAGTNCVGFTTIGYPTLVDWQGIGKDLNSVSVNPVYTAPAIGNYKPTNGAMDNLGNTTLGITTDILGITRSATPDMGAYEFAPPMLDGSISWVAPVGPFVPSSQVITVNISNNAINTITDLVLSYTDGGTPVTETFTGLNIVASTNQTISFTVPYSIVANGTLQASIVSVNGVTDDNTLNDNTLLQTICLSLPGGTYTIDAAVATGSGNYQTFAAAVAALSCGISGPVVFDVVAGSGPYTEQVSIGIVVGSSATNTITFNGNGNTLTFDATISSAPHTFALNGTDYVNVNNMIMAGTNVTNAMVCHLWNNADNNSFTNCTFNAPANGTSSLHVPFSVSGSATSATTSGASGSNNVVTGCTMFSGYYNTCFVGDPGIPNTGNQLINCNITDQYFYGSYNLYQNGIVVSGNTFSRPTRTTLSTFYGVYLSTGCTNALVEKNKFRNTWGALPASTGTQYSIYNLSGATAGNENRIYNNLISDINFNGTIYGIYNTAAFSKIYHNTLSFDQTAASGTTTTYGIYVSSASGVDVQNNNVSISRGGTGAKYCLYYTQAAITSNYNNLYVNSAAGTNCVGFYVSGFATLAAWQAANASAWDQQSTSVDPTYLDPLTYDYHPTNVAMDNMATSLGIVDDITNAVRNVTNPDAGAFEFQVLPTDAGVSDFVSPGTLGCYSTTQDVVVTVKNFGSVLLDFALNPMTVTCNVTGTTTAILTGTPAGTLAPGATMNVTLGPTFDMSANGSYSFAVTSSMTGDGNASNDPLNTTPTRTVGLIAGTIATPLASVCISAPSPTITSTGNYGANIQWQESYISATGPWTNVGSGGQTLNPTFTNTSTGDVYYQAVYTCNTNTATSNVLTINVTAPSMATFTPGSRCGVGTVVLGATANGAGIPTWYATATSSTPLGTGISFTTPSIASTTNFYVGANEGGAGTPMNLLTTTSAGNGSSGNLFDINVINPIRIDSFSIAATGAGTVSIYYRLGTGVGFNTSLAGWTLLGSGAVTGGAAPLISVIPFFVNQTLSPGTHSYILVSTGSVGYTNGTLLGNTFVSDANVQIKEGYGGAGTSFTNVPRVWNGRLYYTTSGCVGSRTAVLATVVTPPTVTATATATTLCVGESTTLSASSPNDPDYTYTWNPGGLTGASQTVTPTTTTTYTLSAIDNTAGPNATCANQATITITVNPIPDVFTASATPASICDGASSTLAASLPIVSAYCSPLYTTDNTSGDYCSLVSIAGTTLNNATAGAAALPNYTLFPATGSTTATLTANSTYTVTFSAGTFTTNNDFAFWIDFNKNGTFEASEKLGEFQDAINGPATYSISFTVPPLARNGITRFRVREIYAMAIGAGDPCASYSFGETEDYDITIVGGTNALTYNWEPGTLAGASTSVTPASTTTYTCTATNSFGCVRTASTTVTVNYPTTSSDIQTECDSYIWNAVTYTSTGIYTATYLNVNGCLHTATLDLTVNASTASTTTASDCLSYTWAANSTTYTMSGTYTATSLNANNCVHTETLNLTIAPCNTTLNLKLFIEGYYTGASTMASVLSNQGEANPTTDCDYITVELHELANPATISYTTTAMLHTDGTAAATFSSAVSGDYYIVIKHRNALQTWSADAETFPIAGYDFSTSDLQAYSFNTGVAPYPMVKVSTSPDVWALYSGDMAVDENIDLLDLALVETDISEFVFGYLYDILNTNYPLTIVRTDINGDGNVDLLDSSIPETNISNFIFSNHP